MRIRVMILLIIASAVAITSCKKDVNVTPKIDDITPGSGAGNALITVTGSGLQNIKSAVLDLGNVPIALNSNFNTSTAILLRVPVNANVGPQHIVFTNTSGFQYSLAFTVLSVPSITSAIPLEWQEGSEITLMGNYFDKVYHVQIAGTSDTATIISAEAKKLVYEDRAKYYADPQFSKVPVEQLISKEYAAKRRALINENKANNNFTAGDPFSKETVYLTVADKDGNMVSFIQSNYRGMGSGMVPDGLGFMLQDRGELFSLKDGHANVYAPGKRPFHTIIPCFITKDGKPWVSFGVMGGDYQPLGHVQIVMDLIDFKMGLQEAGDAPRIDHNGSSEPYGDEEKDKSGGEIGLESGFSYETIRQLMQMGHKVAWEFGDYGGYQAIMYDAIKKVYYGASESRKDGCAMGY